MRILIIPTTDWLGHPFPSRLHHIFEKIAEHHEVHVLRFAFYSERRLKTQIFVHERDDISTNQLALYYIVNAAKHYRAIREVVKNYKIDMVVISNLLAGYVAAKATRDLANMVYDLSDYFPASGSGYYFNVNSLFGKIATFTLEGILKNTLRLVKNTAASSHALLNYLKRLGAENAFLVPNGVDEFFWMDKHDGNAIREKYGLNGYVTVGYIGSIEFWLNMFPLLEAMQHLKKDHEVKLFIVGAKIRTKTGEKVQRQIKSLGIEEDVVWLNDFIPYHDVPHYIAAMDICTIPFNQDNPTAYYSAPNKLWEYLALEKPVITTPIPESITQAGQFVNVAVTSKDYEEIIQNYIKNPDKFQNKAKCAKQLVRNKTWTKIAERYEHILKSIVQRQVPALV